MLPMLKKSLSAALLVATLSTLGTLSACQPTPQYLNTNVTASNLHTTIPLTTQNGERM